jgi:hypothetical protein
MTKEEEATADFAEGYKQGLIDAAADQFSRAAITSQRQMFAEGYSKAWRDNARERREAREGR